MILIIIVTCNYYIIFYMHICYILYSGASLHWLMEADCKRLFPTPHSLTSCWELHLNPYESIYTTEIGLLQIKPLFRELVITYLPGHY